MLDVDGLFRVDDDQPNSLTDSEIMQQQMRDFTRLLAKCKTKSKKDGQSYLVSVAI